MIFKYLPESEIALVSGARQLSFIDFLDYCTTFFFGVSAFGISALADKLSVFGKGVDELVLLHKAEAVEIEKSEARCIHEISILPRFVESGATGSILSAKGLSADVSRLEMKLGIKRVYYSTFADT